MAIVSLWCIAHEEPELRFQFFTFPHAVVNFHSLHVRILTDKHLLCSSDKKKKIFVTFIDVVQKCHGFLKINVTGHWYASGWPSGKWRCTTFLMFSSGYPWPQYLGPVVQSVVSLTSSLRVISLTVLANSVYNILIFFVEKNVSNCTAKVTHIFSAKTFSIFGYHSMKILTNR